LLLDLLLFLFFFKLKDSISDSAYFCLCVFVFT
jgi:hypothetical protein